jgi:hypothetical protein
MAVLSCPHCGSVHIITDNRMEADTCTKLGCRGIMERLAEPEAGIAIRKAFYGHDHDVTPNPHAHPLAMGEKPR